MVRSTGRGARYDVLHDIEDATGGHRGHDKRLMGELGEILILTMKGHDPPTETSGIVDVFK